MPALFPDGLFVDDVNPLWTEETGSPESRDDNKGQLGRVRDIFHPSVIPG